MEERNRYAVGDLVVPVDLPRPFVCSVATARALAVGGDQLLELTPLDGPWPPGTRLVRLDEMVRRAHPTELDATQRASRRRDAARGTRRPILTVVPPAKREPESPAVRSRSEYPER